VRGSCDGKQDMRGYFGGAARIPVAGGPRERRLVVIGAERRSEDTACGGCEINGFDWGADALSYGARMLLDQKRRLLIAGEVGGHGEIVGRRGTKEQGHEGNGNQIGLRGRRLSSDKLWGGASKYEDVEDNSLAVFVESPGCNSSGCERKRGKPL